MEGALHSLCYVLSACLFTTINQSEGTSTFEAYIPDTLCLKAVAETGFAKCEVLRHSYDNLRICEINTCTDHEELFLHTGRNPGMNQIKHSGEFVSYQLFPVTSEHLQL